MSSSVFDCHEQNRKSSLEILSELIDPNVSYMDQKDLQTEINGKTYYTNIIVEEVEIVVRIIRRNWSLLQSVVLNNITISYDELINLREEINKCLKLIIRCLKYCDNDTVKHRYITSTVMQIKTFTPLIIPITQLETNIFIKLSNPSSSSSKEKCPVYQYFHTYTEVQFYLLILHYISGNSDEFNSRIDFIINDLICISETAYEQNSKCAFVCDCNKKFWLIIQILCGKVLTEDSFWTIFNKVVKNFSNEYILWLLKDVGSLQATNRNCTFTESFNDRIKPNFILLESALKAILTKTEHNNSIVTTLKSVEYLVCDLWLKSAKIEVCQMLWEYFSKRLNMSTRTYTTFTLTELVELIDTILWAPKDCQHDFELFLAILSAHLNEHPYHWGKMKGRIYSQLGPNKVRDLNNVGIFHVSLLFISLTKINFDELSKKFLSFIENLPQCKKENQLIWTIYASFVVRHVRENRSIDVIVPPFVKMLEEASTDQKLFYLIKIFVTDFEGIMKFSANLQLHQWLLINSWIHQYMATCYYPDLVNLLKVLLSAVEIIDKEHVWCDWELAFKNYVYPTLKYVAGSRTAPEISGTLAAKIAILSPSLLPEAVTFFNAESIAPKVSANFLSVILENYPNHVVMTSQQETVALQTWVKFCLLTHDGHEQLTRNIIKIDLIPEFVKAAINHTKDPLRAFIEYIGNNIREHLQSVTVNKLCEIFFGQTERWITQYLVQPESEATVLRIYTCLGLAFYKIGPLLYNKHKSNCPYARLVSVLLLPTEVMVGKTLNPYILQSIKKTWQLFFEATVKLNSPNDAFVDRILREMVVKYVPHFAIADSPMLKCFDNETTAEIIVDKMSNAFFKQPTKEAESNIFRSLKIINEFVQATTSASLLKLVLSKSLYGLFEVVMFHTQRNIALSVIKNVAMSPLYSKVKSDFEETIVVITEKHLAFNTPNYFQLMENLSKIIPSDLKNVIPRVKQQISNVERMRGVGYDKNLRLGLERLEANLLQQS